MFAQFGERDVGLVPHAFTKGHHRKAAASSVWDRRRSVCGYFAVMRRGALINIGDADSKQRQSSQPKVAGIQAAGREPQAPS